MNEVCVPSLRSAAGAAQRGISLVFALITLVALALAATALVRSVDNGTLVLGNLGFKQETLAATDDATRTALRWLNNNAAAIALESNGAAGTGYYAALNTNLDPTGNSTATTRAVIDWDGNACASYPSGSFTGGCLAASSPQLTLPNGLTARYVIFRLCDGTGPITQAGRHCVKPMTATTADSGQRGSLSYADQRMSDTATSSPYYRVVVRTRGGRNAVSYTETLVHF